MKDQSHTLLPTTAASTRPLPPAVIFAALLLCGAGSLALYHWARDLHRFTQGIAGYIALFIAQFAIYLLAVFFVLRLSRRLPLAKHWLFALVILLFAAAFRFDLVAQRPYLSTDVYRYLWDGRVQAAGINPYRYVPAAAELAALRDEEIYPHINRRDYDPTPYPPGAQMLFLGAYTLSRSSLTAFKSLLATFDLLAIVAVMVVLFRVGQSPTQALLFAWHPLLIYEGAHSGHIESAFILFLVLALLAWHYKAPTLTGVTLALAALIKYYPALLLPAFLLAGQGVTSAMAGDAPGVKPESAAASWLARLLARWRAAFAMANLRSLLSATNLKLVIGFLLTVALVHLPYLLVGEDATGSLANEFSEEGFTGSGERYFLVVLLRQLLPVPTNLFLAVALIALLAVCVWWLLQAKRDAAAVARAVVALIGLYFFLTTPRYHWYYAWILPFLCFAPRLCWLYLTGATVLLYTLWFTPLVYPEIPVWMGLAIFAPTLGLLLLESRRRPPPAATAMAAKTAAPPSSQPRLIQR